MTAVVVVDVVTIKMQIKDYVQPLTRTRTESNILLRKNVMRVLFCLGLVIWNLITFEFLKYDKNCCIFESFFSLIKVLYKDFPLCIP